MKESRFNLYFNSKDGKQLAFNSLSCGLAIVDENYERLQRAIAEGASTEDISEVLAAAQRGNFVVESEKDELLDYETKRSAQKFSTRSIGLTIAPTLDCNFKCLYCYETRRHGKMTDDTQKGIVEFVKCRATDIKNLEVTWYGGEPLLCMDIISTLSREFQNISSEHAIKYNSFIITNGYLLTKKSVEDFKRCCITGAQVTIDGPKETHEFRRVNRNGSGSFDTILNNVNMLLQNGIEIILRVNVDKSNESQVDRLIEFLSENLVSKNVKITFGQVSAYTDACKGIEPSCYGNSEFARKILEFYRSLEQYGFGESNRFPYPYAKLSYCCAEQMSSFVVDPDGNLYKCWNDVGNKDSAVGNIKDRGLDLASYKCGAWLLRTLPEKCRQCNILPICAGGCPHVTNVLKKPNACDLIRYNIEETMQTYYERFVSRHIS